ncbi:hypothetical protein Golomagni_02327 [Golovinomyces magnicellulatus]|nr:hypothetical protein Golomagni_02327 [Golovinomyces magnicellulatus]
MGNSQAKPCFSDEVNLSHFRLLQVVGRGAFGKVRIVERKDTGLTFALKYIRKVDVVRSESVRNILRERRMLEQLNYQFICNLRYSFQDIEHMYLVVDLMNGGDLRFHISRKTFTEEAVRFWISELGLALRYIHSQGIVHRDIKPDNVLLDAQGHVHLADFNVASDITPGKQLTSKSGTLAYLAPEVFNGNGYSWEADWWSLGVLFYECIYNKRPFEKMSNVSLRTQILEASPKFPLTEPPVSIACMHAISSALEEDPKKRMGCVRGDEFASFTGNPFFQAIDFDALERKEIEPVFVPSSEKTNFDATYDLEEVLLEEAPLEARARRQKPREQLRENASEKEIREEEMYKLIDDQFTPFDYTTAAYEKYIEANPDQKQQNLDNFGKLRSTSSTNSIDQYPSARPKSSRLYSLKPESPPQMIQLSPTNAYQSHKPTIKAINRKKSTCSTSNQFLSHQSSRRKAVEFSGGLKSELGETEIWSKLAQKDTTLTAEAKPEPNAKSTGLFSMFSWKKGRGHSPKARERGVLGKEGARVIINNGE